jgi:CarboxypepD_reg-like domain
MKKRRLVFLILHLCCQYAFSQTVLRGHVFGEDAHKPLASVSVYLNNTSIGTITNDDGLFILKGIPQGKFNLVATSVGFETYTTLLDLRDLPKDFQIVLKPKADELEGFSVLPTDPNGWEKFGKYFTILMIGTTPNSNNTKLMNSEVVKFRLNEGNVLTAFAKEPLKITNYTLGYEIEYKLEEFEVNLNTALVNYTGYAFYKDMGLKHPNRIRRYADARFETYKGSLLHFMRSFYANDLKVQGFDMHSLEMISNPEKDRAKEMFKKYGNKPITSVADATIGFEVTGDGGMNHLRTTTHTVDSTAFFKKMLKQPDSLVSHELILSDSVGFAVDSTVAGFYYPDSMEVSYKFKMVPPRYRALSKKTKHETIPVSEFVFVNKTPVYIVRNGFYYKPYDLKITGYWAWVENVSTWLPYDYYPGKN